MARRKVVGFYTDRRKRVRPITARRGRRKIRVRVRATRFRVPAKTYVIHRNGKRIVVHRKAQIIERKGYTYERVDIGHPGKGSPTGVKIKVERGKLKKFGYSTDKSEEARHRALAKAVKAYGAGKVWRMLHAQVIFRKNTRDRAYRIFKADRDWVAKTYGGPTPTAAIKKWKSMSPEARARAMPGGKI